MKGTALFALIVAVIAIFIPFVGPYIAIMCSVIALITFHREPAISATTFGVNIVNTGLFSPSLVFMGFMESIPEDGGLPSDVDLTQQGNIWFYLGWHVVLLIAAVILHRSAKRAQD